MNAEAFVTADASDIAEAHDTRNQVHAVLLKNPNLILERINHRIRVRHAVQKLRIGLYGNETVIVFNIKYNRVQLGRIEKVQKIVPFEVQNLRGDVDALNHLPFAVILELLHPHVIFRKAFRVALKRQSVRCDIGSLDNLHRSLTRRSAAGFHRIFGYVAADIFLVIGESRSNAQNHSDDQDDKLLAPNRPLRSGTVSYVGPVSVSGCCHACLLLTLPRQTQMLPCPPLLQVRMLPCPPPQSSSAPRTLRGARGCKP